MPPPKLFITTSDLNDDGKLQIKYANKRNIAKHMNISFQLTQFEYLQLMSEAEIKSSDINRSGYHLARYNDEGPYKYGNCRFISGFLNRQEKKISQKQRETARISMQKINAKKYSQNF